MKESKVTIYKKSNVKTSFMQKNSKRLILG